MRAEFAGTPATDETSDAVLLLRTREGDSEAYGALYVRHVGAARILARHLARDPSEADELVAESFTRVLSVLQRGGGPEAALRPYLLSTMRRLHIDRRVAERKTQPTDDLTPHDPGEPFVDRPADELERSIVTTAFAALPERWRLVLWHTEVEGLQPAQVAPLLGISANATAALAVRARAGLRDAYLSAHVHNAAGPGCQETSQSLGGYVRGTLSRRERVAVDSHLDTCARCSAAVLELSDTAATMRAVIGPLILGTAVLAYREGLLALGAHAVPSAALAHAAVATAHGASTTGATSTAGATGGSGSGGSSAISIAGRPAWQLLGAASVVGVVAIAAAFALTGGSPKHRVAAGSIPSASSTPAPTTSTPTPSATPSPTASTTPSPSDQSTPPVTTTAALSLRPAASGVVSLVSIAGDLGLGQNVLQASTNNPNSTAVTQRIDITFPAKISLASTTAAQDSGSAQSAAYVPAATQQPAAFELAAAGHAPGTCRPTAHGATCNLGVVGPHAKATLRVPVTIAGAITAKPWVMTVHSVAGGRSASVRKSGTFTVNPAAVHALWYGQGRYQVSAGGAGLLTCQSTGNPISGCSDAEDRTIGPEATADSLDNNSWAMQPVNDAGGSWRTSSSAQVAIPRGSDVVAAWLSWSAAGFDQTSSLSHTASIAGPGVVPTRVKASSWQSTDLMPGTPGSRGYVATADVTRQVRSGRSGSWTAGNIALASGQVGAYAGWSLVVITKSATAPVRQVTVLAGPRSLPDATASWTGKPPGLAGHAADLTLVAWEGDAGLSGDRLAVRGALTAQDGGPAVQGVDADGHPTYNVAESFARGAHQANTFGVDVRQLRAAAKQGASLKITTNADGWIFGMMVVSTGSDAAGL